MKYRNKQEVFDAVAKHLLTQNEKSGAGTRCFYRHPMADLKCAIGALIPDKLYREDMDFGIMGGKRISVILRDERRKNRGTGVLSLFWEDMGESEMDFLDDLQEVHDEYDVELWPEKLREVGYQNGLDMSALQT